MEDPRTADVTARVIFTGVMLMCINKANQWEVGFIQCPRHQPKFRVKVFKDGVDTGYCIGSIIRSDLYILAENPVQTGVSLLDYGVTSFSSHPDFEGPPMHGAGVNIDTSLLTARVAVSDGHVYTHELTPFEYDLVEWSQNPNGTLVKHWGKLPLKTGINIVCSDASFSGIRIFDNVSGDEICHLPKMPHIRYQIEIDNDCSAGPVPAELGTQYPETDFRLFYKLGVVSGQDGRKFDFSGPRASIDSPRACERAVASMTNSLGFKMRTLGSIRERAERTRRLKMREERDSA